MPIHMCLWSLSHVRARRTKARFLLNVRVKLDGCSHLSGTLLIKGLVISSLFPHTPEGPLRCMGRPKLAARVRRLSIRCIKYVYRRRCR